MVTKLKQMKTVDQINTSLANISMRSEGIIVVESNGNDVSGSLEAAQEILEAVQAICGEKKYPMLSRNLGVRAISKEERHFYMNIKNGPVTAVAMLISNPFERILGNFFMGINKISVPCKLFTEEEAALTWLNQFK